MVPKQEHDKKDGWYNSLIKVDDNTVALFYRGDESGSSSIIKTFDIPADGSTITQVATKKLNIAGDYHKIIAMGGDKYATIMLVGSTQYITTFSISDNGVTITQIDQETESGAGPYGDIVKMDGDTYAVASYGTSKNNKSEQSGSGSFIATYDIPADGSTITKVSGLRHTSGQAYYHSLVKIADDHYALAFSNGTSNGLVKTFYIRIQCGVNILWISIHNW